MIDNWIKALPLVIKQEAKNKNLKLYEVSQQAGFPPVCLYKMRNGERTLGFQELAAISRVIKVSEEDLITRAKAYATTP